MRGMKILGSGMCLPSRVVDNHYFSRELNLGISDEWIQKKIGIIQRRYAQPQEASSDLATQAALAAIEKAKIPADKIGYILLATCTPDYFVPSTAAIVQKNIKATHAAAIDINNSCSGFVYGLDMASRYVDEYETILVIGVDIMSKFMDFKDARTCIYFADGAGAVLVGKATDGKGVLTSLLAAQGDSEAIIVPGGGSRNRFPQDNSWFVRMDGRKVWDFATRVFPETILRLTEQAKIKLSDLDWIIPHQANAVMIEECLKKLGIPKDKCYLNIQKYGNTVSASMPIALHEAIEDGTVQENQTIALVGFGAGLAWGGMILRT